MKKAGLFSLFMFILMEAIALAGSPGVMTIVEQTDKALAAMRAGSRKMVITVKDGDLVKSEWVARRAHKVFPDGKRELMVILEPEDLKGNAYMYWKPVDKPIIEWVYATATRRVRNLSIANAYESFFGTDFTYVDLDIRDPGGTHKLLGEEEYNGKKVYKLETTLTNQWYYSRIVSLISSETFLPIKRDYYDARGRHWKTKLFEDVTVFMNIPIPRRIVMLDIQRNHSTVITFSDICRDVDYLTLEDFDAEKLPEAALSPVCTVKPAQDK